MGSGGREEGGGNYNKSISPLLPLPQPLLCSLAWEIFSLLHHFELIGASFSGYTVLVVDGPYNILSLASHCTDCATTAYVRNIINTPRHDWLYLLAIAGAATTTTASSVSLTRWLAVVIAVHDGLVWLSGGCATTIWLKYAAESSVYVVVVVGIIKYIGGSVSFWLIIVIKRRLKTI